MMISKEYIQEAIDKIPGASLLCIHPETKKEIDKALPGYLDSLGLEIREREIMPIDKFIITDQKDWLDPLIHWPSPISHWVEKPKVSFFEQRYLDFLGDAAGTK